jgi:DNA-binding GntR family transcriptional regulator
MSNKLRPLQTEDIAERLRQMILSGEITRGQKINQNAMAREFGTSRTPVTKALQRLEAEGLVDNIPNAGYFLHVCSLKEMAELFEIRQCIEMISAANAAQKASTEEICNMRILFEPFLGLKEIDVIQYLEADRLFHLKLLSYCENERLLRINHSTQIYHQSYVFGLLRKPQLTLEEHIEIIDSIKARDARRAKYLMMSHLEVTGEYLRSAVDKLSALGMDPKFIPFSNTLLDRL